MNLQIEASHADQMAGLEYLSLLIDLQIASELPLAEKLGELYSKPEYKIGIRWEPNNTVIPALTYGAAFDGSKSSRFEIGVIIITPPFLKRK